MRIYFSGGRGIRCVPESLVPKAHPHVMLTFYDIMGNSTLDRLNIYLERCFEIMQRKDKKTKPPSNKVDFPIYCESMFMDSGAYSLYGKHVLEGTEKVGKHGRILEKIRPTRHVRFKPNYSFYSLKQGSEFRKYCDRYASFMRKLSHTDILFTTVDAIHEPIISWNIQQFFEKEHGLKPVPVIHGGTLHAERWLARYIEGGHDLIGFGGLGHKMRVNTYRPWVNALWRMVCPKSNNYMPIVRVHGFAMTSWEFMKEWPWWSVDSATWTKLAAYGWIVVPRWSEEKGFHHDKSPYQINVSYKPTERKHQHAWRKGIKGPRQMAGRHYENVGAEARKIVDRWLKHIGIEFGEFQGEEVMLSSSNILPEMDPDNFEITEIGASSDFRTRAKANLDYFVDLQASLPSWPQRLSDAIINEGQQIKYKHGLGL